MGKDYKVKEIDLSGVKFIHGKYYYIDSFSKKLTEFDIYDGYSCAAEPPVRCGESHQSGL